jgi:hypothetical protein
MSKMGRLRIALVVGLLIACGFTLGALIMRANEDANTADSLLKVGQVEDFPPGSVTARSLSRLPGRLGRA